jgi:hypothetical protein
MIMKRIIESLYGMQYEELIQNGKDGNKARVNGNLFLAAYAIVILFLITLVGSHISHHHEATNRIVNHASGIFSSVTEIEIGELLLLPLLVGVYLIISVTIGSERSFQRHIDAYTHYSDRDQRNAFQRVLLPFMVISGLLLLLCWL